MGSQKQLGENIKKARQKAKKINSEILQTQIVQDKEIEEARKILGDLVKDWPDERIRDEVAMTKFLVESWLDEYERKTFGGKTLAEIVPGFTSKDFEE